MAYITDDKIGLHILPVDGNPHNSMALTAHPLGVSITMITYSPRTLLPADTLIASMTY